MAYKWNGGGYVDTVFEKGHEITDEEVRKSRGHRRPALAKAQELQQQGYMRLKDMSVISYSIRSACLSLWPEECIVDAPTEYIPRGRYGEPQIKKERWIKSPIEGVEPWQVMKVAEMNYSSRPMFRATWEAKLALEMSPDEVEVELMMFAMAEEQNAKA